MLFLSFKFQIRSQYTKYQRIVKIIFMFDSILDFSVTKNKNTRMVDLILVMKMSEQ